MTLKQYRRQRIIAAIACALAVCVLLATGWFFSRPAYDTDWIVGKTAEQIQDRYGEFDRNKTYPNSALLKCAYYDLKPRMDGEHEYNVWIEINFDENGVAISAREDHNRHGG